MVRIVQKIGKYAFYNYLDKLGFGELTEIQLAGEKEGKTPKNNLSTLALAKFFNNAYGQGILTTQIQLATAYAALVNGGEYIKPTIINTIIDKENPHATYLNNQDRRKVFKNESSKKITEGLWEVMTENADYDKASIEGIKL